MGTGVPGPSAMVSGFLVSKKMETPAQAPRGVSIPRMRRRFHRNLGVAMNPRTEAAVCTRTVAHGGDDRMLDPTRRSKMSQIAEQIVEDAMQRIEANEQQHAADPVRNFSLTLTDPAEIRVGAEIYFLFEQRLKGFYPDARVVVRGHAAEGYNITAQVERRRSGLTAASIRCGRVSPVAGPAVARSIPRRSGATPAWPVPGRHRHGHPPR
ncbi:hypothetical protein Q3H58_004247 [Pseudomonas psychrotolerans]|nr:hypothetical protein [Pseudomonas psychrotolerans]